MRFQFGQNWHRYLRLVNEARIESAEESLRQMLRTENLAGKAFLDIGSGSGLFSLAARRLGARVYSFDLDVNSVGCAKELQKRYYSGDSAWIVEQGSVLDTEYLQKLGRFEIVYSWGVLHHTGYMWRALENASERVTKGGLLYIAIYNDQGWISRYWFRVKQLYNANLILRRLITFAYSPYFVGLRVTVRALKGTFRLERGMSFWFDMKDWLGGYPFETAKPEMILEFLLCRGFSLLRLKTCGGRHGCNEYVFERVDTKTQ